MALCKGQGVLCNDSTVPKLNGSKRTHINELPTLVVGLRRLLNARITELFMLKQFR